MKKHVELGYSGARDSLAADNHLRMAARKIRTKES